MAEEPHTGYDQRNQTVTGDKDIAAALRAALPEKFHADIPALAQVLADVFNKVISPEDAAARLTDPTFMPILQTLSGRHITPSSINGDIAFDNIGQGEGIAIGHQATAQNATGSNITQASDGGFALVVNVMPQPAPSPPAPPLEQASFVLFQYFPEYLATILHTIKHPNTHSKSLFAKNDSSANKIVKLGTFMILNAPFIVVGATMQTLIPEANHPDRFFTANFLFYTIWFFVGCIIHLTYKSLWLYKGDFFELLLTIFQRMTIIYLVANFIALIFSNLVRIFSVHIDTLVSEAPPFITVFIDKPFLFYFIIQGILLFIYLPPIIRNVYRSF